MKDVSQFFYLVQSLKLLLLLLLTGWRLYIIVYQYSDITPRQSPRNFTGQMIRNWRVGFSSYPMIPQSSQIFCRTMSSKNRQDSQNETLNDPKKKLVPTRNCSCSNEVSFPRSSKVTFGDVVEEKMLREKKGRKEPKLKTVTRKIQRLLFKPFDYDANLS